MLDIITKSKVRKNILKLLFSREDKEFYLSEIARIINASPGNAQRELNKLVQTGLLSSSKKAISRYYRVNQQNSLYGEFKKIIAGTIGIEAELKRMVLKIKGIDFAFIFGSYAKGGFSDKSDIDLFVVGSPDENLLIKNITLIEKDANREVNYHIYSKRDFMNKQKTNSFIKNVTKNYLLLTDNQNEFNKLLP